MANETPITLAGRLAGDPELRFTPSGAAVVNFTVACNDRQFDKQANEWVDGDPVFWRCTAWRDMAERVSESLQKGHAVVLTGSVKGRKWADKEGQERLSQEVDVQHIGPDLRWMEAQARKAERQQQAQQSGWGQPVQQADPWSQPQQQQGAWGGGQTEQAPF